MQSAPPVPSVAPDAMHRHRPSAEIIFFSPSQLEVSNCQEYGWEQSALMTSETQTLISSVLTQSTPENVAIPLHPEWPASRRLPPFVANESQQSTELGELGISLGSSFCALFAFAVIFCYYYGLHNLRTGSL